MTELSTVRDIFHITVGTAPHSGSGLSLESDLRLLKAAVLYADKVRFCSMASSFLITLLQIGEISGEDLLKVFANVSPEIATGLELYQQLKRKKRRNRKELIALKKVKHTLDTQLTITKEKFENLAIESGIEHLAAAIKTGIVEVQLFEGADSDSLTQQYFDSVSDVVLSGKTYPLFDDLTGDLVSSAIKDGTIKPHKISLNRAKQVGLSSNLLQRLPLFDDAPMNEIIDIRRELAQPLRRFRAAIITFSRDVESAAWDAEFRQEAEQVFREHVEPAVLDLEAACQSNKLLRSLIPSIVDKPIIPAVTSGLGLLLAEASHLPDIVTAGLGLTAGGAAVVYRTVEDWRNKNREIEGNHLYFYYKAGKLLAD